VGGDDPRHRLADLLTRPRGVWRYLVAVALLLAALAGQSATASAASPVGLDVRFGSGVRLGGETPLSIGLQIDPRRVPAPMTELRMLLPADLDITLSGLGLATCRRPKDDYTRVLLEGPGVASCPENALLGQGSAAADLRFSTAETVKGSATLRLYAGAEQDGRPGLVALVATAHPIVTQLVYGGRLYNAARPFGLGMLIAVPAIPAPPFGATVALVGLRMTIGGADIVYAGREHGHRIHYVPGGVPLPTRCPRGGFRFRALLAFADGTRHAVDDVVRCPPRAARRS
jgi:hypothetical protein